MDSQKYKICVILGLVFIILGTFLQLIINFDKLIINKLIINIKNWNVQVTLIPISLKPTTIWNLLLLYSLVHKV